jgi:TonB-dependent SusC/RagA subfamily outer membrane receptor
LNGAFSLKAPKGAQLAISYVGYISKVVTATSDNIVVVLDEDTKSLEEVVVLGYGANTRKQDLSASVGVMSNVDDLVVRPVSSTESMMQGQLAGVTVESNGGDPTGTPNIVIRGQGSQNGDNVLWVVDGVPGAPIASLNDIESIVVLKDAASAAIYGAQSGAGGVILVTTKKASVGAPSLTYDGTYGVRNSKCARLLMLTQVSLCPMHGTHPRTRGLLPLVQTGWTLSSALLSINVITLPSTLVLRTSLTAFHSLMIMTRAC